MLLWICAGVGLQFDSAWKIDVMMLMIVVTSNCDDRPALVAIALALLVITVAMSLPFDQVVIL